jgi:ankyrin repeat protein
MGAPYVPGPIDLNHNKLMEAVAANDSQTVRRMIAAGADVNRRGTSFLTPLLPINMAVNASNTTIAQMLIEAGATVPDLFLHQAVLSGNLELVRLIARNVANKHDIQFIQVVGLGITPIETAVFCRRIDMLREILASGADLNFVSPTGHTALSRAVSINCLEIVNFLLANGANINLGDSLNLAVIANNVDLARLLIDRGADIPVSANPDDNLLALALRTRSKSMAVLLVRAKAELADSLPEGELARVLGDDPEEVRQMLGNNASGRRLAATLSRWRNRHGGRRVQKTRKRS